MTGRRADEDHEITGINVTPLVDIMLVLLIIFMVTATYVVKEVIAVELPRAAAGSETPARTLAVVVARDGRAYLDGVALTEAALAAEVAQARQRAEELQAMIAADRDARHGAVIEVLDLLGRLGVTRFAIQVERETKP
jgi:biopolymer transport protein TolR